MTDLRRRYKRSAVAVICGLVIAIALIALFEHFATPFISGHAPTRQAGAEMTAISRADRKQIPSVMLMHETPQAVPEFTFTDGDGKPVALADFQGKLVLLNIWATWCGPCRREMPTLDRLQAELSGPGFEVIALSIDRAGMGVVDKFYAETGIRHLARYIDESGASARKLSAVGLPTTLLIDREGREIARHVGPAEWDTPEMVAFFRKFLDRKAGALSPSYPTDRLAGLDLPLTGDVTPSAFMKGTAR